MIYARLLRKGGESKGNRWSLLLRSREVEIRRGGKSELRRAGWFVIRTVPEVCKAEFGNKESATENIPPAQSVSF